MKQLARMYSKKEQLEDLENRSKDDKSASSRVKIMEPKTRRSILIMDKVTSSTDGSTSSSLTCSENPQAGSMQEVLSATPGLLPGKTVETTTSSKLHPSSKSSNMFQGQQNDEQNNSHVGMNVSVQPASMAPMKKIPATI